MLLLLPTQCAPLATPAPPGRPLVDHPAFSPEGTALGPATDWEPEIFSPRNGSVPEPLLGLQSVCGRPDAALAEIAERLLAWPEFESDPDAPEYLDFALRAAGVAYVWPRAWLKRVAPSDDDDKQVAASLARWLASFDDGGERRCGLARAATRHGLTYAALVVDVMADVITRFPTRTRTGQWLELNLELVRPGSEAKVIRLGPTGEPTLLPTTLTENNVRARFPMASPGQWSLQVMAVIDSEPRPVAELMVFVDDSPPSQLRIVPVPGESAQMQGSNAADSLFFMLNQARADEGRKPLKRNAELDRLAFEHASAMLRAGHTGHDVGDGLPGTRMSAAGLTTTPAGEVGENVVRAADARRAHRALWASPSHRSAILHRGFRNVGVGALSGPDRTVWACELFAALD